MILCFSLRWKPLVNWENTYSSGKRQRIWKTPRDLENVYKCAHSYKDFYEENSTYFLGQNQKKTEKAQKICFLLRISWCFSSSSQTRRLSRNFSSPLWASSQLLVGEPAEETSTCAQPPQHWIVTAGCDR